MNDSPNAKYLRRKDAGQYVFDKFGFPCSPAWLAKLASLGGGPTFRKAGNVPLYATDDLDEWAAARLSQPVRSTSELSQHRAA